jgi:hypothetical protein
MGDNDMPTPVSRRSLLRSSAAIVPGLAMLAMGRSAKAFSIESMDASSGVGLAYATRCGNDSMHPAIRARLQADLANRTGAPGTTLSETAVCPICGCPITVTREVQ